MPSDNVTKSEGALSNAGEEDKEDTSDENRDGGTPGMLPSTSDESGDGGTTRVDPPDTDNPSQEESEPEEETKTEEPEEETQTEEPEEETQTEEPEEQP